MNDCTFLRVQSIELRRLLENAGDDPILVPQLKQRIYDVEEELKIAERAGASLFPSETSPIPRLALFLKGGGVQGREGIRPTLAGEALIQYEKMFTEQAIYEERIQARTTGRHRRPRGTPVPGLLFTGTPRGSFGLELVPQRTEDAALQDIHVQSLKHVANALVNVSDREQPLEKAIEGISPGALRPMQKFFNVLAQYGAELRLAFSDAPSRSVDVERLKSAAERMEQELVEEEVEIPGIFRGLTRESTVFDLVAEDGTLITGSISDDLAEEDFDRIDKLLNQRCVAKLHRTTLRHVSGLSGVTYVLLDARPAESGSGIVADAKTKG